LRGHAADLQKVQSLQDWIVYIIRRIQMFKRLFALLVVACVVSQPAFAGLGSEKAKYIGGTLSISEKAEGKLLTSDAQALSFTAKEQSVSIPYESITSIEYGQKAGRRIGVAVMISPLALFSKKRKHYLTLGFTDAEGRTQGAVFELGKDIVRTTLVTLEARTGKEVQYESEEAKEHVGN
jgi:hypothetical protein